MYYRETLDELNCDLYQRNVEYQSVDYAAIEKEDARRSRVSLKVPPYAFTTINTNGSEKITEKAPVQLSDEECLYDNPDENPAKRKQEDDKTDGSHRCSTPEIDDTYDNPLTVEKVKNDDAEDMNQYSSINDHEVTSNGKNDEAADHETEAPAVELQEIELPYLYSAVDKSTKSIHSDDEL